MFLVSYPEAEAVIRIGSPEAIRKFAASMLSSGRA
jgi:hypothetical protein